MFIHNRCRSVISFSNCCFASCRERGESAICVLQPDVNKIRSLLAPISLQPFRDRRHYRMLAWTGGMSKSSCPFGYGGNEIAIKSAQQDGQRVRGSYLRTMSRSSLLPNVEKIRTRAFKVVPNRCEFRHWEIGRRCSSEPVRRAVHEQGNGWNSARR